MKFKIKSVAAAGMMTLAAVAGFPGVAHAATPPGDYCRNSSVMDWLGVESLPCITVRGDGSWMLQGAILNDRGNRCPEIFLQINEVYNGQSLPLYGYGKWDPQGSKCGPHTFNGLVASPPPKGHYYNLTLSYRLPHDVPGTNVKAGQVLDNVQSRVFWWN